MTDICGIAWFKILKNKQMKICYSQKLGPFNLPASKHKNGKGSIMGIPVICVQCTVRPRNGDEYRSRRTQSSQRSIPGDSSSTYAINALRRLQVEEPRDDGIAD